MQPSFAGQFYGKCHAVSAALSLSTAGEMLDQSIRGYDHECQATDHLLVNTFTAKRGDTVYVFSLEWAM